MASPNKTLIMLAWRNVWRHRRRSLITMSAIVFAMFMIAATVALQDGTYDGMERAIVRAFTGDVQVHHAGFYDEPGFSKALSESDDAINALAGEPGVVATTKRLTGFGLISSDSTSTGALILGIVPETESQVSNFHYRLASGRWLTSEDDQGVILGDDIADNISACVGDTIVVLTQGYRNEMGADIYTVVGTIDSGNPELDRNMMAMNLADAQFLFSMPGRYTELVIVTDDFYGAPQFAQRVAANLDSETVEVMPWAELLPELKQARALDDAGNNIFYLFLIVLLGFEIFNTATVSVMERVREFGVLQSIGMKPGQITALVFLELTFKVAVALVAGGILLAVLAALFGDTAIPLSSNVRDMYEDMGFLVESITFSTKKKTFILPYAAITTVSLLAMIYPILKVRSFSPIKAFRHI